MKSDAELHADGIAGGPEAFGPIVTRYKDAIFGIALARVRDFHAAEDVAQSVLIAAYERLGSLQDPARLGAWLRSMTIHQSIDHLRARRPVAEAQDATMASSDDRDPAARLERKELRERVLAAIGRLSKTQRETTTLFYVNGYSVAEVAAIQEVPVGTVKGRLHDARERLKEDLIGMVADVLKSEAPKEDLAQRVFEVISRRGRDEHDVLVELRRIGAKGGVAGLVRAMEAPAADTRQRALSFAASFDTPENHDQLVPAFKRALHDPNSGVRALAIREALTRLECDEELKRTKFVRQVVELLFDRAKVVRREAARALLGGIRRERPNWAADVPLETAARAVLDEPDGVTRKLKEDLLRAALDARGPAGVCPPAPQDVQDRLGALKERLKSPSSAARASAVSDLLDLRMPQDRKRQEVLPLVLGMLGDRSKRVRWRTAYELCAWAADVPIEAVEKACRAETRPNVRRMMQRLLRRATQQQERGA